MKRLIFFAVLCITVLISASCQSAGKQTYSIEGKDSLYVGEVSNSIVVSNLSKTIPPESITWDSSHKDIATVSYGGVINALSEGITEISATFEDNGKVVKVSRSIKTEVFDTDSNRAPLLGYTIIGNPSISLGDTERFTVFHGEDMPAIVGSITWSSGNPDILSIGKTSGIATAQRLSSSVVITAKVQDIYDNMYIIEYPVQVISPAGYKILGDDTLYAGQRAKLEIGSNSNDLSDIISIHWSSDNEAAVSIQEDTGLIDVYKGSGEVSISALVDTTFGTIVLERDFKLQNGAFILEYDLSSSSTVKLPFSKFRIIEQGKQQEFVLLDHSFTIDWGDGAVVPIDTQQNGYNKADFIHDYSSFPDNRVTVMVYGSSMEIDPAGSFGNSLVDVKNWGNSKIINECTEPHQITLFHEASLRAFSAKDGPYLKGCMDGLFRGQDLFYGDLSSWDVSDVTSMNDMFLGASNFDGNLGGWDTSSVATFDRMFKDATSFQGVGLDMWETHKATSMDSMFASATSFNANLREWDVRSVRNFNGMFLDAENFAGYGLGEWQVNAFAKYNSMFEGVSSLQESLSNWELLSLPSSPVANISMFKGSGLLDTKDHPNGCTSACGVEHIENL